MKTGIKIAMMSLLTFSLVGCNDFLDTTPHDSISDKVVWNDIHTATLYLNGFYWQSQSPRHRSKTLRKASTSLTSLPARTLPPSTANT